MFAVRVPLDTYFRAKTKKQKLSVRSVGSKTEILLQRTSCFKILWYRLQNNVASILCIVHAFTVIFTCRWLQTKVHSNCALSWLVKSEIHGWSIVSQIFPSPSPSPNTHTYSVRENITTSKWSRHENRYAWEPYREQYNWHELSFLSTCRNIEFNCNYS